MLAWHCILLASLQVHLHGDGACLGLHVGIGFSAPRVAFNMTRQPDVITGAVVATACHGVLAATSVAAPCRPRGATPASSLGASVSSRCHRRRRQLDPVIGRQPGSESYRGVVACHLSVLAAPSSLVGSRAWCGVVAGRTFRLHHLLGVSITCSYNTSSATWMDDDPANASGRVCACKNVEELGEDRRLTCGASEDEARRHGFFPGSLDSLLGLCLASTRLTRSPPAWCG